MSDRANLIYFTNLFPKSSGANSGRHIHPSTPRHIYPTLAGPQTPHTPQKPPTPQSLMRPNRFLVLNLSPSPSPHFFCATMHSCERARSGGNREVWCNCISHHWCGVLVRQSLCEKSTRLQPIKASSYH